MRIQGVSTGLNSIPPPVILGLAGYRRQSLYRQRFILPRTNINWNDLLYLLDDPFPGLLFAPKSNTENLDILNYVSEADGQYLVDLVKMSKSENFSRLFHEDFPALWDEKAARKQYGKADVIRFFIDIENNKFLHEFSKIENANKADIEKDAIPNMFLDELGYYNIDEKKPVWEEWDFSKIVKHKSPDIYKAFTRYAHKQYTLLGFGLWKLHKENPTALKNCTATDLLLAGNKLLDAIVREEFPETDNFSIERRIAVFEAEQEILESVPEGANIYKPTEIKVFTSQLKSRIPGLLKIKSLDNPENVNHVETFSQSDRKNIKKYFENLGQYIENMEDFNEYRETQMNGTYREKVMFLYQQIWLIRKYFSEREIETIYGLTGKLNLPLSFDEPLKNNGAGESFILYDILGDDKAVSSDEHLSWAVLFTDVFKQEFDDTQMKKILECIPRHFEEYPPKYDNAGNFNMTYYSKKELYRTFCITAGIEDEQQIWEMFLEMIQEVIENINRARSELRSRL